MPGYQINFSGAEIYECGAILISLLAYPDDNKDDDQRSALYASLCALSLRAKFDNPEAELIPQPMKPIHAFRELKQINRDLKTLKRRLRDRMVAARMAIPFLQEAETGTPPPLPASVKRLSINQMAELVFEDAGQKDPENVETRVWRVSLPVIHLAAATQVLLNLTEKSGIGSLSLGDLIWSRPAIEYIVREAERYEALLAKSPRLTIDPNKLVKLRLASD
jgi:hypothetical protein